ncbi:MAG: alpha/beta hydrolase [Bacteroidetes bacterium 43-16]|nr:MAG: alpha/beta hydrolase [Bacteroidetes bacterium 43-16]
MEAQYSDEALVNTLPGFSNHYATVNGTTLHYVSGGTGEPLVLVPGYPETWWAYHKVMPLLASKYRVIVVEMRGMGSSAKPADGYEKKNMAKDVYELVQMLGLEKVYIGGHDIGAHVAFSFAANYPATTAKLMVLDTPHPDEGMYHLPMLPIPGANHLYPWWLAFNQVKELPEQLLEGRMEIVIAWLFEHLIENKESITAFDKAVYAAAYNSKDAIRASNGWYQAFPQDIADSKTYRKLNMPVMGIGGSGYEMLAMSLPASTSDLQLRKVAASGHFILTEQAEQTAQFMMEFLG